MSTPQTPTRGWGALLTAVVAIAVFLPSLANGFAYDDVAIILGDPRVHSLSRMGEIFTGGYWGDDRLAIWRPLTTLSLAVDWSIGSGNPAWFHLVNTLLHGAASVLVFLLLARWFRIGAALAGGLLFAVHPVHVEAVANIVGRAEILAGAAVLGALLLWTHEPAPRMRIVRTAGVATLLAVGLAAKESALVLLPLILLVDVAEGRLARGRAAAWLRANVAALGMLGAVAALWFFARSAVLGTLTPGRVDAAFDIATSTPDRVLTALQAWPVWLRLLFAPVTLLADYGPRVLLPAHGIGLASLAGALLLGALLAGGLTALTRGAARTAIALLWFPLAIVPVSNLFFATGVIVAERTLYLPSVAVAVLGAACVGTFAPARLARPAPRIAVLGMALVLGLFAGRTLVRIPAWQSTASLYAAQVADRPDSFRAQWYLAREAKDRGDVAEAAVRYDAALALWPYRRRLNVEAAAYAAETGRLERARAIAGHAVTLHPDDLDALRILAATAIDLGDSTSARGTVTRALALHPDDDVLRRMDAALNPRSETQ